MLVLGISCFYHDAAAAIVRDGVLVAAAEEERFNRRKHFNGFPAEAIRFCLNETGATVGDLDAVVFYEKPIVKFNRLLETILAGWPRTYALWMRSMPVWLSDRLRMQRIVEEELGEDVRLLYCPHHLSHAASAFLVSGFDEAAILTADGVGEWTTAAWGVGRGVDIDIRKEIRFPHSLGLFYSALTAYLGFRVNDAEWKVMGLAAYGTPRYLDRFREVAEVREDGSFRLNMRYFDFPWSTRRMFSRRWERLFGAPARRPEEEIGPFHEDIARSGQLFLEEILVKMARHIRVETGMDRLCLAGGVALNSVANWRMFREAGFREIFIQPAAGDAGGALGAAHYAAHCVLGVPRAHVMKDACLGPAFSAEEIRRTLTDAGAEFERIADEPGLLLTTAREIAGGKVVGWFQGRMEFGPRALGCRSILADPRNPRMKEIINAKVKYREPFRPFAPSVLKERAHEWFDMPAGMDAPFMLLVPDVREEKRATIPAVTHADGTGRVQTVAEATNPLYYRLIRTFEDETGVPVILNTSFNVRGEPIVCTPGDAWATFVKTGIDVLVIGDCIVRAKPATVDHASQRARSNALESTSLPTN